MEQRTSDRETRAEANAEALKREISKLKDGHWNMLQREYGSFWKHNKEIRILFKTLKPLRREDRERLWTELNDVCDEVRRREEDARTNRRMRSQQERNIVMGILNEAYHSGNGARDREDFSRVDDLLAKARDQMQGAGKSREERMLRDDHQVCWERYQEARAAARDRRSFLSDGDYSRFRSETLSAASEASRGDPWEAKRKIKEIQQDLRAAMMKKFQWDDVRRILSEAWETASIRIGEELTRRRESILERISRLEALREKNEGIIDSLQSQIDDLEGKISSGSDAFADRARGWISEKEQKIDDIRSTNRELEDKVRTLRDRAH